MLAELVDFPPFVVVQVLDGVRVLGEPVVEHLGGRHAQSPLGVGIAEGRDDVEPCGIAIDIAVLADPPPKLVVQGRSGFTADLVVEPFE